MPTPDTIEGPFDDIAALRREIHAQPELGFEERRTSDLVAQRLTGWGIAIDRSLAQTAVVGLVHGRDGGACGRATGAVAHVPIQWSAPPRCAAVGVPLAKRYRAAATAASRMVVMQRILSGDWA